VTVQVDARPADTETFYVYVRPGNVVSDGDYWIEHTPVPPKTDVWATELLAQPFAAQEAQLLAACDAKAFHITGWMPSGIVTEPATPGVDSSKVSLTNDGVDNDSFGIYVKEWPNCATTVAVTLQQTSTVSYVPNPTGPGPSAVTNMPSDTNNYLHGASATVLKGADGTNPPQRQDWNFNGWNTAADGTGTVYQPGQTISMQGNVTLYAQWKAVSTTYKVEHYKVDSQNAATLAEAVTVPGDAHYPAEYTPKSYPGYELDLSYPGTVASGTIAANGSTVLKLYYVNTVVISKSLVSSPQNGSAFKVGEDVEFVIAVRNSGTSAISGLEVVEGISGTFTASAWGAPTGTFAAPKFTVSSLPAKTTMLLTFTHTVTQADVSAATMLTNTVTAAGATATEAAPLTKFSVVKTVVNAPEFGGGYRLGEWIVFDIAVTNNSSVAVGTTLTEFIAGEYSATGAAGTWTASANHVIPSIVPGGTAHVFFRHQVTQTDVNAGNVVNSVATEDGGGNNTGETPVTQYTVEKKVVSTPANGVAYVKGEKIRYEITVKNNGSTPGATSVIESLPGEYSLNGVTWTSFEADQPYQTPQIAPNATWKVFFRYTVTAHDADVGSVTNKVVVAAGGGDVEGPIDVSRFSVSKSVASTPANKVAYERDEHIVYEIAVANGGTAAGSTTLNDMIDGEYSTDSGASWTPRAANAGYATPSIGAGVTWTVLFRHKVTQADVNAGSVTNTVTTPTGGSDTEGPTNTTTFSVVKSEASEPANGVGYRLDEHIVFNIVVTNESDVRAYTTVADALLGEYSTDNGATWQLRAPNFPFSTPRIDPGQSYTLLFRYKVTQADVDAGAVVNGVVTGGKGGDVTDPIPTATFSVKKSVVSEPSSGTAYKLGEHIVFTIEVTNEGSAAGSTSIKDSLNGETSVDGVTWTPYVAMTPYDTTVIQPGKTWLLYFRYTVNEADVDRGSVVNNVITVGGGGDETDPAPVTQFTVNKDEVGGPANGEGYEVGEYILYVISVHNSGTGAGSTWIKDSLPGDYSTDGSNWTHFAAMAQYDTPLIQPSATWTVYFRYQVTEADAEVGYVVNEVFGGGGGGDVTDPVKLAKFSIAKTVTSTPAEGTSYQLDEYVVYNITVTNKGSVAGATTINDMLEGEYLTAPNTWVAYAANASYDTPTIPAKGTWSIAFRHKVTVADVDAGSIVNRVTTTDGGGDIEGPTDVSKFTVTKTVDNGAFDGSSFKLNEWVVYRIQVKNVSSVTLSTIVTETMGGQFLTGGVPYTPSAAWTTGTTYAVTDLAAGETANVYFRHLVNAADVVAGSIGNSVTVSDGGGGSTTAPTTRYTLTKVALPYNGEADHIYSSGEVVAYQITITNTGSGAVSNVPVKESIVGTFAPSLAGASDGEAIPTFVIPHLVTGATVTLTFRHTVTSEDVAVGALVNRVTTADGSGVGVITRTGYRLTYHGNGAHLGSVPAPVYRTVGETATITGAESMGRFGYTYRGWATNPYASSASPTHAPGAIVTMTSNLDLYAVWSEDPAPPVAPPPPPVLIVYPPYAQSPLALIPAGTVVETLSAPDETVEEALEEEAVPEEEIATDNVPLASSSDPAPGAWSIVSLVLSGLALVIGAMALAVALRKRKGANSANEEVQNSRLVKVFGILAGVLGLVPIILFVTLDKLTQQAALVTGSTVFIAIAFLFVTALAAVCLVLRKGSSGQLPSNAPFDGLTPRFGTADA
jgi:uncharacterized repeat protein (TIGR02543 family)